MVDLAARMEAGATNEREHPSVELDRLLGAQIIVAWAGEAGEEPRLGWWKTDMVSEFGGEDLFQRLLPRTWEWAVVRAVREAARRRDAELRAKVHDPDGLVTLYNLGFTLDERLDERIRELAQRGLSPKDAFPELKALSEEDWSRDRFQRWVEGHGPGRFEAAPAGRQLAGPVPDSLSDTTDCLVAALAPLADHYPLPHLRRSR